jgi:2-phospho-L-lactate guanylyltransferase (CobY/MobA/RfbA family)
VVDCQTPGLDIAVTAGRDASRKSGAEHIVVAHADLPLATSLEHVVRAGKVSMVPDRHRDGTNVLAFPVNSSFTTAYGPGSFDNHVRLAALAGLEHVVINDASLELDLDTADDLGELARRKEEP